MAKAKASVINVLIDASTPHRQTSFNGNRRYLYGLSEFSSYSSGNNKVIFANAETRIMGY